MREPVVLAPLAHEAEELDRRAELAGAAVSAPRTPWLGWLAGGAIAWRDGRFDAAAPLVARVIDDIRAGSALRAIAHVYAARIADARGDA